MGSSVASLNKHIPIDAVVNRTKPRMPEIVAAQLFTGSVAHMVNATINPSTPRTHRSRSCQWLARTRRCFEGSFSPSQPGFK